MFNYIVCFYLYIMCVYVWSLDYLEVKKKVSILFGIWFDGKKYDILKDNLDVIYELRNMVCYNCKRCC